MEAFERAKMRTPIVADNIIDVKESESHLVDQVSDKPVSHVVFDQEVQ